MQTINLPDLAELAETLPTVIPAQKLSSHLNGLYTAKTLSNRRWQGKPPRSYKLGRKALYLKSDVLAWIKEEIRAFDPDIAA